MTTPSPKPFVLRHALAFFAGAGLTVGIQLAPPVFTGAPPPSDPGVVCHVEKTGTLQGQQVCEFVFGDAGFPLLSAGFPLPSVDAGFDGGYTSGDR